MLLSLAIPATLLAQQSAAVTPDSVCEPSTMGSQYISVDNWIYPEVMRLYSLGYVDSVFLGLRPWTRASLSHMLEETAARLEDDDKSPAADEAQGIYDSLLEELNKDMEGPCLKMHGKTRVESVYTLMRGISGTPLLDSYYLGQSIVNDYGRPYEGGSITIPEPAATHLQGASSCFYAANFREFLPQPVTRVRSRKHFPIRMAFPTSIP